MSHATTITRDRAKKTGTLARRIGALAFSLVVGVAIGYTLVEVGATDSGTRVESATGIDHERFLMLNTTALEYAPAQQAAVELARSVAPVDHFVRINTTGLESQGAPATGPAVDAQFLDWNVGSLEWSRPAYSQPAIGPR